MNVKNEIDEEIWRRDSIRKLKKDVKKEIVVFTCLLVSFIVFIIVSITLYKHNNGSGSSSVLLTLFIICTVVCGFFAIDFFLKIDKDTNEIKELKSKTVEVYITDKEIEDRRREACYSYEKRKSDYKRLAGLSCPFCKSKNPMIINDSNYDKVKITFMIDKDTEYRFCHSCYKKY